jgi:hypothetical protein
MPESGEATWNARAAAVRFRKLRHNTSCTIISASWTLISLNRCILDTLGVRPTPAPVLPALVGFFVDGNAPFHAEEGAG